MSEVETKQKPRNRSLLGLKDSISTQLKESVGDRDSVTKIRINESFQMKSRRKLYRPSTATKKR